MSGRLVIVEAWQPGIMAAWLTGIMAAWLTGIMAAGDWHVLLGDQCALLCHKVHRIHRVQCILYMYRIPYALC